MLTLRCIAEPGQRPSADPLTLAPRPRMPSADGGNLTSEMPESVKNIFQDSRPLRLSASVEPLH